MTFKDYLSRLKGMLSPGRLLVIDEALDTTPRWGHGRARHQLIYNYFDKRRDDYTRQLARFLRFKPHFAQISTRRAPDVGTTEPCWVNEFLPALDAIALYGLLAEQNPSRYYEIGSGNSTMFARRAIIDHRLRTEITSFDPQPRAQIDSICDRVHRMRLEQAELSAFEELENGDILFFDGSHYVFTNTDVVVLMLEILPRLKPGVLVHLHDIWLPSDYPPHWQQHWFAEQYLVAAYILGGSVGLEPVLPNRFISDDPFLFAVLDDLWETPAIAPSHKKGGSLWLRTTGKGALGENGAAGIQSGVSSAESVLGERREAIMLAKSLA